MKNKCNNFETQNRILLLSNIYNLKKKKKRKKKERRRRRSCNNIFNCSMDDCTLSVLSYYLIWLLLFLWSLVALSSLGRLLLKTKN